MISTRYRGSSSGLSYQDVLGMEYEKICWWIRWLDEKWAAEDKALGKRK